MPNDVELKGNILEEPHITPYSVHPGNDKLYKDLRVNFRQGGPYMGPRWLGPPKNIVSF